MDKRKLISKIASHFGLDETGVSIFVDSIFDTIARELNKGKNINIPEFGKFIVRNSTANGVRGRFITFSPSKKFAEEINNNYSNLNPVVIKMKQPEGQGIRINEIAFEYGDDNFAYLTFENDIETENEIITTEEDSRIDEPESVEEQALPLIQTEENIPEAEIDEQPLRDVPYLIVLTKDKHQYTPEKIKEDDFSKSVDSTAPIEEDKPAADETTAPIEEDELTAIPEEESEKIIFTLLPEELIIEDNYIDVLEEQISAEKEIIIKDIEDYLFRGRNFDDTKIEETFDIQEDEFIPEDFSGEPDNYFKRENVYTDENSRMTEKAQNVFLYDYFSSDFDESEITVNPEQEIEQNVFLDLENFFNGNENIIEELIQEETVSDKLEEIFPPQEDGIEDSAIPEDKIQENAKHEDLTTETATSESVFIEDTESKRNIRFSSLKDDLDTAALEEEILQMLASREKAIKDLSEYGLKLETNVVIQPSDDSINGKEDIYTPDEVITHETVQQETIKDDFIQPDDDSIIIEDTPEIDIYEELNKRYLELEEIAKTESIISDEEKTNLLNSEMTVFDRLTDDKPEPVKETPPQKPLQQIIIHDPVSRTTEKEPESLADALDNVHLDGIIEHLEGEKDDSEIKSYDDVFKPADRPFIPNSSPVLDFKKPKKWLKFFMYLVFIVIFSMMSFFLYKSILTPSKSSQHADTTGIKNYDSLSASMKLADTSFKTGAIVLNEFEIEKDGDIIYRQTENGFIIQIADFEKHSDALKFITNLKDKSIEARIERIDLPMDKTEYRIVIGPFATLQEAKSYFSSSKMLLNYMKVLTPSNTNIFF
ncbi:MAG: HU family DNA-binding protein [Ignavibacteria bacterium]|nr:HU family DNA-binding protein [Ignavibacteria bacterium]